MAGVQIHGVCDPRFEALREAFHANFDDGAEIGASLRLTHQGRTVVDLWAGWADRERTRPWQRDTIVHVASTTKIMVALAALMLVDRGRLELDAPVARYWPEFAAGGKDKVTVRDALSHQAGVPGFDPIIDPALTRDWDAVTARVAAEPHWFGGRRKLCYHAHTYGYVVGELIRRADGRGPQQFFREEIAVPAGADFQIGLTDPAEMDRLAWLRLPQGPPQWDIAFPPGSLSERYFRSWTTALGFPPEASHTFAAMSLVHPASVGLGNGRSIARVCAILAMRGELDGVRYLSPAVADEVFREQAHGRCVAMGPLRMGLCLGLDSPDYPAPSANSGHWGGTGGSWGIADPVLGYSLGYAPNDWDVEDHQYEGIRDPRQQRFFDALQALLPTL
jgi:CubicO group peptidase (beta-lactamase class C family)